MPLITTQRAQLAEYLVSANGVTHFLNRLGDGITNWYIGLNQGAPNDDGTGLVEPTITVGNYARIQVASTDWDASSVAGLISNDVALNFPQSTAAWSTTTNDLTHFVLYTAASGGSAFAYAALNTSRQVNGTNITLTFAIGDLSLQVS